MTELYRHFDAEGTLLYVGVSLSAVHRLGQHKDHSHWFKTIARVEVERFETREQALQAERRAILAENPRHNLKRPTRQERAAAAEAERRTIGADESRRHLVQRIVAFNALYDVTGAAAALGYTAKTVRQLIEDGRLGAVPSGETVRNDPRYGQRIIKHYTITGWQLIEFIESLEARATNRSAA